MTIMTRLTDALHLRHPVISAPMAIAAGGALAAAVSRAGGLGFIGGGYGDSKWLEEQFRLAGDAKIGCGFITWSLAEQPHLLEFALFQSVVAIFLSFGDPTPFAAAIKHRGVKLICQVQTLNDARRALDCGADVLVAQGSEAGGHGQARGTISFVPEVADLLAARSPETLLCAAGGIADGRGLAAALMLGADGVVVGTRFWASREALVHPKMHEAALAATGDDTIRSSLPDIVRSRSWPARFTARTLRNRFTETWRGREAELERRKSELADDWNSAWANGDTELANTFVGEAVGVIRSIEPAGIILSRIVDEATTRVVEMSARIRTGSPRQAR